jgi:hypothetical protein
MVAGMMVPQDACVPDSGSCGCDAMVNVLPLGEHFPWIIWWPGVITGI